MIKTVKSSLNHPPPSSHHQHHPNYHHQLIQHGLSSSGQLQESSKFISIKNTNGNDLKLNLTTRPVQSVLSNDLDSISTSSCDDSWDAQHGRLVSKLMSKFIRVLLFSMKENLSELYLIIFACEIQSVFPW